MKLGKPVRYAFSAALAAAIVAALVYWMDFHTLLRELGNTRPLPVVGACLLNLLVMAAKGLRWYYIGADAAAISRWQAIRLTVLAFFFNSFIPARGGDVLRGLAAARENRTSKAASLASVGADKLMDMLTIVILVAAFPFLPRLPSWIKQGTALTIVVTLALLVVVLAVRRRGLRARGAAGGPAPSRIGAVVEKLAVGFDAAARPGVLAWSLVLSLASWGLQVLMVTLATLSAGLRLGLPESACALLVLNIAVSVPLTPLNVGTLHAAFVGALICFGYPKESALTAAIVLHVAYTVPLFVVGPFLGHKTLFGGPQRADGRTVDS